MERSRVPPRRALVLGALAFSVILSAFPSGPFQLNEHPVRYHRVFIFVSDLPLLVLTATVAMTYARRRPWSALSAGVIALLVLLGAAVIAHPSLSGAQTIVRAAAAAAIAGAVSALRDDERVFFAAMIALTALAQTTMAIGQVVARTPLGLIGLGEIPDPLLESGTSPMPRGTTYHPYVLAGLALVSAAYLIRIALDRRRAWPWLALATVATIPVGLTYSRAALICVALALVCLMPGLLRRSRVHMLAALALAIGVGVPAAVTIDGWVGRARSTLAGPPDRLALARQGLETVLEEPLVGVGPARYLDVLADRSLRQPSRVAVLQEPHIVPILVGAEAGAAAGVLTIVVLALLTRRAAASGTDAVLVVAIFAPILFLDHYPYTHPQGLILLGLWAGTVSQRRGHGPP